MGLPLIELGKAVKFRAMPIIEYKSTKSEIISIFGEQFALVEATMSRFRVIAPDININTDESAVHFRSIAVMSSKNGIHNLSGASNRQYAVQRRVSREIK